jgi:hypothetical protein
MMTKGVGCGLRTSVLVDDGWAEKKLEMDQRQSWAQLEDLRARCCGVSTPKR